jgi:hypothetical protein
LFASQADPAKRQYKEDLLKMTKEANDKKDFAVRDVERHAAVDLSQVVDLYDEVGMLEELDADNLVIDHDI